VGSGFLAGEYEKFGIFFELEMAYILEHSEVYCFMSNTQEIKNVILTQIF